MYKDTKRERERERERERKRRREGVLQENKKDLIVPVIHVYGTDCDNISYNFELN